ncbi:hypothetical protein ACVRY7_01055 [Streptococcus ictaluri]|uniref:Uncharacterized protein n=1 Tax=Streptococcus ictaluri 707-05 TaxID=764299 RepID=G5K0A6_9STRE|nr:hypothetical protein [Streptococcus ictaluri]EHI70621.1 hypothetical protein STRIC_0026 [Streptococcus ictaluri 707-05]
MNIKRNTRFSKMGAPVTILIGDYQKVSLYNHDSIELAFDSPIYLAIKHSKQAKRLTQPNENLVITDNPLNLFLFWGGVFITLASQLILSFDSPFLFWLALLGLSCIISSYFLPRFKWENQ